jgi:hypothetical protein
LQLAAESADADQLASPVDIVYARGWRPTLDQLSDRGLTIDELQDLQDQLYPTLSEPQRTGN